MNKILRISCLVTLLCIHNNCNTININNLWSEKTIPFLKGTAISVASLAAAGAVTYYLLLPAATQTASNIGTAIVHETANVAKVAAEKTAPFGAGGYLVHYLLDEFGIESHQGMRRAYAASMVLYLLRKQLFMTFGI
jgi:hypothetical protein